MDLHCWILSAAFHAAVMIAVLIGAMEVRMPWPSREPDGLDCRMVERTVRIEPYELQVDQATQPAPKPDLEIPIGDITDQPIFLARKAPGDIVVCGPAGMILTIQDCPLRLPEGGWVRHLLGLEVICTCGRRAQSPEGW